MTYTVDIGVNWGQSYTFSDNQVNSASEAEALATSMFLEDYGLSDNLNVGLLGLDISVDEEDDEEEGDEDE